eukprot:scaffold19245_cov199-Amphora_coffeaeformis.AAC.16
MDSDDLKEANEVMMEQKIPLVKVASILADAMQECLGKELSAHERELWHDSLGQALVNMTKA